MNTIQSCFFTELKCPADCSGNGRCFSTTGTCQCYKGYSGPDCSNQENWDILGRILNALHNIEKPLSKLAGFFNTSYGKLKTLKLISPKTSRS